MGIVLVRLLVGCGVILVSEKRSEDREFKVRVRHRFRRWLGEDWVVLAANEEECRRKVKRIKELFY